MVLHLGLKLSCQVMDSYSCHYIDYDVHTVGIVIMGGL